jgi:very-short-patch-repair endonuclease
MVAALIRAGEGAVLSHATAAWWWGLIDEAPKVIELSATRRISASEGFLVHRRRHLRTTRHRRFPLTTLPQTFLDLAATAPLATVRRALAQADYLRLLDPDAVAAITGQGIPGSVRLREALKRHQPRLAHTRSELERAFMSVLEAARIPAPEVNVRIEGWPVDALWRRERVVVELDGLDNHHSPGQIERDRRKELVLRRAGFVILRYTWEQVTTEPELVIADLVATLVERAALSARPSFPARSAAPESR